MVNPFEMMQQAQNGTAVEAMARQFGLTPKQAENAVDVLLPAFALALQRQMANPHVWPVFPGALQPAPASPLEAGRAATADGMRQGAEWMERLFGSSDLSRQVAAQAAAVSGLPDTILQQMMPAMATMLMSGMLKTFSQKGFAGVIDAMGRAMQAGATPAPPSPPPAAQGANPMSAAMEAWAAMLGAAAEGQQQETPDPEPEPAPSEPGATTSPASGSDAFAALVETGREAQDLYLRNLRELFASVAQPDTPEDEPRTGATPRKPKR